VAAPLAVYAGHQFTDVPDGHIFHTGISWMKDNNITVGCNPPANTQFCPDDNVTRGQMATFMKRLAENKVVNAADSETLGGKAPSHYQGIVAGALIANLTPAAAVRTRISRVTGFNVPQDGGALVASADIGTAAGAADFAFFWLEIDRNGACDIASLPLTAGVHTFTAAGVGTTVGTTTTAAVNAGDHQVDLCTLTANGTVNVGLGSLTVQWVETTQGGTTATVSTGRSPEQMLEEYVAAVGN